MTARELRILSRIPSSEDPTWHHGRRVLKIQSLTIPRRSRRSSREARTGNRPSINRISSMNCSTWSGGPARSPVESPHMPHPYRTMSSSKTQSILVVGLFPTHEVYVRNRRATSAISANTGRLKGTEPPGFDSQRPNAHQQSARTGFRASLTDIAYHFVSHVRLQAFRHTLQ